MAVSLSRTARKAEEISAGLQVFQDNLPDDVELGDSIEDLLVIAEHLSILDQDYPNFARRSKRAGDDANLLMQSLTLTMDRLQEVFRQMRYRRADGSRPYRRAWEDLHTVLRDDERGPGLGARMEVYSMFSKGILSSCRGRSLQPGEMQHHRDWIARLLRKQEHSGGSDTSSLNGSFANMSFGPPPVGFPPMPPFFRTSTQQPTSPLRPTMPSRPPTYPTACPPYPPGPRPPYPSSSRARPPSTAFNPPPPGGLAAWWDEWDASPPPIVPEPPNVYPTSPASSDTSGFSNFTYSSSSSNPRPAAQPQQRKAPHWASGIFDGRHPTTYYRQTGPPTKCLGRPEPNVTAKLRKDAFQEVLRLSFESTNTTARLYWRAENQRARLLLSSADQYNRPVSSCIPLTALKLVRKGPCLQLNRLDRQTGDLERWANLTFDVYERLVLFYCAFAAMKSQDDINHPEVLADYFYTRDGGGGVPASNSGGDEQIRFAGVIQDGQYLHALRILEDRECGGLRLEARPRRGPMQKVPIWTAFCSTDVMRREWATRVSGNCVVLDRLRIYTFMTDYEPLGKRGVGEVRLEFESGKDAVSFLQVLGELRG